VLIRETIANVLVIAQRIVNVTVINRATFTLYLHSIPGYLKELYSTLAYKIEVCDKFPKGNKSISGVLDEIFYHPFDSSITKN
jgi:hypothetical protein